MTEKLSVPSFILLGPRTHRARDDVPSVPPIVAPDYALMQVKILEAQYLWFAAHTIETLLLVKDRNTSK